MGTKNVYYICDNTFSSIPGILNDSYIKSNQFREIGFKDNRVIFNDESVLIIFEPVKIDGINYSIYKIWKRYFEFHFTLSKIIVVGFINKKEPNYLDLLNLPNDFQTFLSHALPVNAEWEAPVECSDLLERMKQFFKGHGKESLISQLNSINQSLNSAYSTVMNDENSFQEILDSLLFPYFIPEWRELRRRWDNYFPIFEYLPFFSTMKSINETLKGISQVISANNINENTFLSGHFGDKIVSISNQLLQIDKNYIRPEIYNEK